MSPYQLIYSKQCFLLVELDHKSIWVIKGFNLNFNDANNLQKLQLNEYEELRNDAYENFKIIKEKSKTFHDKIIFQKIFEISKKMLLYNFHFYLFSGKLKSKWSGLFMVKKCISTWGHGN